MNRTEQTMEQWNSKEENIMNKSLKLPAHQAGCLKLKKESETNKL